MDYCNYFKDKKITLMGLGLLGRGVGDAAFLAECGADVLVTDLKGEESLEESLDKLKKYTNITYRLGEHKEKDFIETDMVIKSAGVPLNSPYIQAARDNNVSVEMSSSLFAKLSPAKLIGVTGTRGKSTTTQMIYEILKKAGCKTLLGGNIKGVSTLAMLPEANENTTAVLELDSWQLQGFGEAGISPQIAVFTNFFPDHLNYYGGDMDRYFADKANIFLNQDSEGVIVSSIGAGERIKEKYPSVKKRLTEVDFEELPQGYNLQIPGKHNRLNAALAKSVGQKMGISEKVIKLSLEEFQGVSGRLEKVGVVDNSLVYNDTTSTTPEATAAALEAISGNNKTILIAGGADKNLDMEKMAKAINKYVKYTIFLEGKGTERFLRESEISIPYEEVNDLKKAVDIAFSKADLGEPVLFSPGFSSFNMFKNEFDRGERFNEIIKNIES